jgi:Ca-activated chloride channel family protein
VEAAAVSPAQLAHPLVHPEWTAAVGALFALAAAALILARARARRLRRCLGPRLRPGLSLLRDGALLLALAAVGVALLGPRLGEKVVRVPASGIDLVLLLDVSRSMDAADVPPSRFSRARRAAEGTLARLHPGDRAALAAFASRGVLLTPLTPDRGALAELLAALDTDLVHPAGSSLGAGVRAALTAFEAGSARPRLVFVLSDGEDPERRSDLGAGDALRAEARVLAAAFGSEAGANVPDHGLPLRDATGAIVVSRRRTDRLERLASATGGALFNADAWGEIDLDAAVAELRRDAGGLPGEMVERRVRATRVLPFAALAFALLAAEGLPRPRRRALLAGGLCALLVGAGPGRSPRGPAEARPATAPPDAGRLVDLGLERLARGRRDSARRAFLAGALSARDPSLAALAYYDLGVVALEQGDFEGARDAFFDALALAPEDREARYNLEWALEALPTPGTAPESEPGEEGAQDERPQTGLEPRSERPEHASASELSEEQRRRWLGRVKDDLDRALRSAARSGESVRRGRGPAW